MFTFTHVLSKNYSRLVLTFWALACAQFACAEGEAGEEFGVHAQTTYIWQGKRAFAAAYTGPHSLTPAAESSYSFTATAFIGWRPWRGMELYLNPEAVQGVPLSGLNGLGGFTNGEMQKTAGASLTLYRARVYARKTWALSEETEPVESDKNQLGGRQPKDRFSVYAGNLAVSDLFDNNVYAHDPRADFMNWAIMTHDAYDFAADARGYTWGVAAEWVSGDWALRAARFAEPKEPNQQALDARVFAHYGDQLEVEHAHEAFGLPGKLRLLAFRDRARMARFDDALASSNLTGAAPSLDAVRNGERVKFGFGVNLEQTLKEGIGLFARASWADGGTEVYSFTEIDRSLSAGVSIRGQAWGRAADNLGLAVARNELSGAHRDYLARGGLGFFIGDGALNYAPETILEGYYRWQLVKTVALSLDAQRISAPAYNADRGPVRFIGLRLHAEY